MRNSKWVRLLAYVTGSVNQELLEQDPDRGPRLVMERMLKLS
jgi:hypothetical protein